MRTSSAISCLLAFVVLGVTGTTVGAVEPAPRAAVGHIPGPHVRGASKRMSRLLEQAIKQSPTFAELVSALDTTDVIVHVQELERLPAGVDGRLTFVVVAGEVRYLRAQVRGGRSVVEIMSTVGHELQHALEVAMDETVRDTESFGNLYQRIGDQPAHRDRYDTEAARTAGRRVKREMS